MGQRNKEKINFPEGKRKQAEIISQNYHHTKRLCKFYKNEKYYTKNEKIKIRIAKIYFRITNEIFVEKIIKLPQKREVKKC